MLFILCIFILCSCQKKHESFGDQQIIVFENEDVNFLPDTYKTTEANDQGIIRLASGRILLKKIEVPDFERTTKASVKLTVASAGDRWDKSGSCFVLPKNSLINLLNLAEKKDELPAYQTGSKEYKGIGIGEDYLPTIELLRFMTPFGIGAYNDSLPFRHRKTMALH